MSDLCKEINKFGKGIGNAARYRIIEALLKGRKTVNELTRIVKLSQPAVSHHLRILRQAGLINDRRQGKWVFYSLNPEAVESAASLLDKMLFQPTRQLKAAGGGPIRQHPACVDDVLGDCTCNDIYRDNK